jgi:pantoate kinase
MDCSGTSPHRESRGRGIYVTPSPNYTKEQRMASTPEAKVKAAIRKILDTTRAYYAMPMGSGYGNSGVPDFLVCHKGQFIGIEAKAGKGKTTALQDAHIAQIRTAGGVAMVVNENNLEELKEFLNEKD